MQMSNLSINNNDELTFNDPFIDTNEFTCLMNTIAFIIVLDCRLLKDFQLEHIKNSKHINCRDRITKKRLASRKLSVKDLINCEQTKKLLAHSTHELKDVKVILYDEESSDVNDLKLECNPLQILLDNIKNLFNIEHAKVLKGGFKGFQHEYPHMCTSKQHHNVLKSLALNIPRNVLQELDGNCRIDAEPLTKITPYLYLGNESDAKNEELLKSEGITCILNVTKNIPCYLNAIKYKRVSVNDACDQNLKQHFDDAYDFIEECQKNNSKVLVHCQAGISRSPTVVIAYLMKKTNRKMNEIYQEIADKRKIIGPNLVFMSQLYDYEETLQEKKTSAAFVTFKNSSPLNTCHTQFISSPLNKNIKVCN